MRQHFFALVRLARLMLVMALAYSVWGMGEGGCVGGSGDGCAAAWVRTFWPDDALELPREACGVCKPLASVIP